MSSTISHSIKTERHCDYLGNVIEDYYYIDKNGKKIYITDNKNNHRNNVIQHNKKNNIRNLSNVVNRKNNINNVKRNTNEKINEDDNCEDNNDEDNNDEENNDEDDNCEDNNDEDNSDEDDNDEDNNGEEIDEDDYDESEPVYSFNGKNLIKTDEKFNDYMITEYGYKVPRTGDLYFGLGCPVVRNEIRCIYLHLNHTYVSQIEVKSEPNIKNENHKYSINFPTNFKYGQSIDYDKYIGGSSVEFMKILFYAGCIEDFIYHMNSYELNGVYFSYRLYEFIIIFSFINQNFILFDEYYKHYINLLIQSGKINKILITKFHLLEISANTKKPKQKLLNYTTKGAMKSLPTLASIAQKVTRFMINLFK